MAAFGMTPGPEWWRNHPWTTAQNDSVLGIEDLPQVESPEEALATTTREDYFSFLNNFSDFEEDLLGRLDDTSLVDTARDNAAQSRGVAHGIRGRLAERFGQRLTPVQERARTRRSGLQDTLGEVQSLSDARFAQEDANQSLFSGLYNIGQGLQQGSLDTLRGTASTAASRRAAEAQRDAAKGPGGILGLLGKI